MTPPVRTVFGMPAYGRSDSLARTLESLLGQTRRDFAIVIVDDRPTAEVRAIVDAYRNDGRLVYEPNPTRLGMVGNWHYAFTRGRQLFPQSEYFAWVSDHDVWHPRWLEVLGRVLDDDPRVVLACPQVMRVYRKYRRRVSGAHDTRGVRRPAARLEVAATMMTAGNAIYGLFRAAALERAGVFRPVLLPDRQVLCELALFGEFVQAPEILWYREVAGEFSYERQRRMFFTERAPFYTNLPVNVQHSGLLLWDLAVRGVGRPDFGRVEGAWYAALHLWLTTRRTWRRSSARWRTALDRIIPGKRPAQAGDAAEAGDVSGGEHVNTGA